MKGIFSKKRNVTSFVGQTIKESVHLLWENDIVNCTKWIKDINDTISASTKQQNFIIINKLNNTILYTIESII